MQHLGFLGLGIMGSPMAKNLLKAGYTLSVWNRTGEKCDPLVAAGAMQAESPAAVAQAADITFGMVSDPKASEAICFEPGGVLEGIGTEKGYVDISTVAPETSMKIAQAVAQKGGRFLEAPVSGSKKPAEDGALVFLCAGDKTLFEDAKPAFDIMGKKSFYLGETGHGARMKLVINMIMGTMMSALSEGLALGSKVGLQSKDILSVLEQGAIDNPMFRLKGPLMSDNNFATAFPLKHMQKDLRLATLMGNEYQQTLPTAAAANNSFIKALDLGCGDEDFSAVLNAVLS